MQVVKKLIPKNVNYRITTTTKRLFSSTTTKTSSSYPSDDTPITTKSKTIVSSHDEFSPLKHIIIGRAEGSCIAPNEPASKHKIPFDSDMRGQSGPRPPQSIINAAKQLDNLQKLLESHGITVDRPEPIDWNNKVKTPWFESETEFGSMPPRDVILTVGNEMLEATMSFRSRWFEYRSYRQLLYKYWKQDLNMKWEAAPKPSLSDDSYKLDYLDDHESADEAYRLEKVAKRDFVTKDWVEVLFDAADVLRLGKDLFVQHGFTTNLAGIEWLRRHFPNHRVHALNFPGDQYPIHIDCSFVPLRPGLMLNNPNRRITDEQKKIFDKNGWQIVDGAPPAHTTPPPLCYSSVWLSMNTLVIDDKYIVVEESEVHQIEQLKKLGFEPVPIAFRDAYPFGGGLHCSTTDVRREGICEDYFPNQ